MAVDNVKSEWFGDEIAAELERATVEGMENVGAEFVRVADPLTPVDEGDLRKSTRTDPVKRDADGLSIEMGSFDIRYALHVERGTSRTDGKMMYQRSADATWPKLNARIKSAMRKPAV